MAAPSRYAGVQSSRVDPVPPVPRLLGHRLVARRAAVWHGLWEHPLWAGRGHPERTGLLQAEHLSRWVSECCRLWFVMVCVAVSSSPPRVSARRMRAADWLVSGPAAVWAANPGADPPPPLGDGPWWATDRQTAEASTQLTPPPPASRVSNWSSSGGAWPCLFLFCALSVTTETTWRWGRFCGGSFSSDEVSIQRRTQFGSVPTSVCTTRRSRFINGFDCSAVYSLVCGYLLVLSNLKMHDSRFGAPTASEAELSGSDCVCVGGGRDHVVPCWGRGLQLKHVASCLNLLSHVYCQCDVWPTWNHGGKAGCLWVGQPGSWPHPHLWQFSSVEPVLTECSTAASLRVPPHGAGVLTSSVCNTHTQCKFPSMFLFYLFSKETFLFLFIYWSLL